MSGRKPFFAKHSKSCAALVSLAVHVVLIIVALTFVAVSVVIRDEVDFEAKAVNRPSMKLKALKVPMNVKKQPQQPKLRKQIVATPRYVLRKSFLYFVIMRIEYYL